MPELKEYFTKQLSLMDTKIFRKQAEKYIKAYAKLNIEKDEKTRLIYLVNEFQEKIQKHFDGIQNLQEMHKEYLTTLNASVSAKDKKAVIIDFLLKLGAKDIKGDIKAFKRWFDADVASERYIKLVSIRERELKYLFDRYAFFLASIIRLVPGYYQTKEWEYLNVKKYFLSAYYYTGDHRVKHYAFMAMMSLVDAIPYEEREDSVSTEIKQFVIRFSQDAHQTIELQQDALNLLIKISRSAFESIIPAILSRETEDYFFVRARCANLICRYQHLIDNSDQYIETLSRDSSEYVRQKLYEKMLVRGSLKWIGLILPSLLSKN